MKLSRQFGGILGAVLAAVLSSATMATSAAAQSIIDTWGTVQVPPPPALQPVTVSPADTALLLLDFSTSTCSEARRPSCVRSLPHVEHLLAQARAAHMLVVYSTAGTTPKPTPPGLAPQPADPTVNAGVDKFFRTDLEKILAAHGIRRVIVTGTSAHGAVLYTASAAALRGLSVIVPVDGFSADTPFAELYTAWHLKNAPASVSTHVTLTRSDMIEVK